MDVLPIISQVINKVHKLAESENQPTMKNESPSFEYSPGLEFSFVEQEDNNTDDIENEQVDSPAKVAANSALSNNAALISEEEDIMSENSDDDKHELHPDLMEVRKTKSLMRNWRQQRKCKEQ